MTEHIPEVIHFSAVDEERVEMPHDDALVVEAIIHNFKVQKILVHDGSKVSLLPYREIQAIKILLENLVRDQAPMKRIVGIPILVEGKVKLLLTLEMPPTAWTQYAMFFVVRLPLAYNAILGRWYYMTSKWLPASSIYA